MNPEVSIIIPTYNSEAYLAQALESVISQTYRDFEIILIDDASTDSTVKIARNFKDKRLKIICNKHNRGVSYGRNCGIKVARGNWIALLDSDDWYAPERLEKLLSVAKRENADLVADNLNLIRDRQSQPWSTLLLENQQEISSVESIDAINFVISDRPNPITAKRNWSLGYTKPLIKRKFLLQHGIEYDEAINVGEDFILYLECLRQEAHFVLVPEAYYYYRTRSSSLSTRKPTEYLSDSCKITQIFITREIKSHGNSNLLKVLFENSIIYQKRLAYYLVLEAIKRKKIIESIKLILDNPYTLGSLVNRLAGVLQNKIASILESKNLNQVDFNVASVKE
ncbi:glycosyltransferase family 2 protein [Waterburya agarophytonicola K14]|uniref:Glycosyltransferase family 2 protein n=1 Tax=Waterburya agarophytonicola KI4 TaxID=2874699 RepID=A0A964FHK5_9CYAN|nr:glycosyltransferase family 2 protein [Waterburya agarophytonicola]MCC0177583.1 glycosyltransferase family 2 protein [Waterburya agarophytonicola KI4]